MQDPQHCSNVGVHFPARTPARFLISMQNRISGAAAEVTAARQSQVGLPTQLPLTYSTL